MLSSLGHKLLALNPAHAERRRHPRFVSLSHAAIVGEDGLTSHCLVQDLSLSGAQIVGGMQLVIGELVRLSMQLPGRPPLQLSGRVVRRLGRVQEAGRWGEHAYAFGISFVRVPKVAAQLLSVGLEPLPHGAPGAKLVLVVDTSSDACAWAVRELGRLGHQAIAVTSALDAVEWLLDDSQHFDLALINIADAAADGTSLWQFLGEMHPQMRRLTYGEVLPQALPAGIDVRLHNPGSLAAHELAQLLATKA